MEKNNHQVDDLEDVVQIKNLYLDFKTNRERLVNQTKRTLKKNQPHLFEQQPENIDELDYLIQHLFSHGAQMDYVIANTSLKEEYLDLTIRPVLGPRLSMWLGDNSIAIRGGLGHSKDYLIVNSISDIRDCEIRSFETKISVKTMMPEGRMSLVKKENSVLNEAFICSLPSISLQTKQHLSEWHDYLKWQEALTKVRLKGVKYINIENSPGVNEGLVLTLLFQSKEEFKATWGFIRRNELKVYNNTYSTKRFMFEYNEKYKGRYQDEAVIGACMNRIVFEGELDDTAADLLEPNLSNEILRIFETPYLVKVMFRVSDADKERLDLEENLEMITEIKEAIIKRYGTEGFLSVSAVGDFALQKRQRQIIEQLERGEGYSPYLASWLFDINQSDTTYTQNIVVKEDEWLNNRMNDIQKSAVNKLLNSKDIFLIQGPPGTGKTTVIAEAIYQLTKRGKRIILASQANLAVDNVLERLIDTPEIRAIRLGAPRKISEEGKKYIEQNVLKSFYSAISQSVKDDFLSNWQKNDEVLQVLSRAKQEIQLLKNDINQSKIRKRVNQKYIKSIRYARVAQQENYQQAHQFNNQQYQAIQNIKNLIACLEKQRISPGYIDDQLIDIIWEHVMIPLNQLASILDIKSYWTNKAGIIAPYERGTCFLEAYKSWLAIKLSYENCIKLDIANLDNNNGNDPLVQLECDKLTQKIDRMDQLLEEDSDNEELMQQWRACRRERTRLSKQLKQRNIQSVELLSSNIVNQINTLNSEEKKLKLEKLLNTIIPLDKQLEENIQTAIIALTSLIEDMTIIKIDEVEKAIKKFDGLEAKYRQQLTEIDIKIKQKQTHINQVVTDLKKADLTVGEDIEVSISELETKFLTISEQEKTNRQYLETLLTDWTKRLEDEEAYQNDKLYFSNDYIKTCNLVGVSCTENQRTLSDKELTDFDVAIIDEVSKATPPELLLIMIRAKQIILVGDHRQLPPVFNENEQSYKELIEQLKDEEDDDCNEEDGANSGLVSRSDVLSEVNFERFKDMVTASLFKNYFEQADEKIKTSLFVQYRMHPDIMSLINFFYDHKLTCGLNNAQLQQEKNHQLNIKGEDELSFINEDKHAVWIDSSYDQFGQPVYETQAGTSKTNELEIKMIFKTLVKIDAAYQKLGYGKGNLVDVGVISFYGKQVGLLKRELRKHKFSSLHIDINTVDKFQGKEKSIILVSLVRNTKHTSRKRGGHVASFERINVAFSRAKKLLLIYGASHMYEKIEVTLPFMDREGTHRVKVYENIINEIKYQGAYFDCKKLLSEEDRSDV